MKIKNATAYNCPNCGAEITHSYNHKCEYCGGMLDFNEPETIEVKAEDLVDIELKETYFNPGMNKLVLVFDGYKCTMPKVYEYDGSYTYISKVEEYINPPKCGMCIQLDTDTLRKEKISYIYYTIARTGIRDNELEKVIAQVVNNEEVKIFGGLL